MREGATEPGPEEQARLADRAARRARREEGRARQRAQNVVRAAKMHEARLAFERERGTRKPTGQGPRVANRTSIAGWPPARHR